MGIDDGPFLRDRTHDVLVAAPVFRGGEFMEGLLSTRIRQDGFDSTDKLTRMVKESRFYPQLHYLMLDGIALGGFNVVDLERLHQECDLPVMVVTRRMPDLEKIRSALDRLDGSARRWDTLLRAGPIHEIRGLCCQFKGMEPAEVEDLLELTCTRAKLPEPLRVAHIVAGGITTGESRGRA